MILRVTDKDDVRERHFTGATATAATVSQKYYSPFSETEVLYKPATGKEILCYVEASRVGGGQFANYTLKIWANTTIDSKVGGRDIFSKTFSAGNAPVATPPFVLKAGEYLNIEGVSGSATGVAADTIVGVERDAT